ncbi:hypothetical protein QY886_09540 [Latilactobacillus sakei]
MLQLLAPAAKDTITVNYKSGATTIWTNTTAAQPTGAYLTYGKAQNVIASKTANGVTWYQLENKGWVPSSYVVLNNPNLAGVTPITDAPAVTPVATTTATTTPAASTTTTTPAATTATSESATQTSTTQQQAPAASQSSTTTPAALLNNHHQLLLHHQQLKQLKFKHKPKHHKLALQ